MLPIGVLILARDSAETIERALRSVQSVAQQVVVLDTGSQDDTPSRCLRLGAEVYSIPWVDDFAATRNAGLQYIHTPWVLALDSDEELETETLREQAYLLHDPAIGGVEIQIRSVASARSREQLLQVHWYPRLFRHAEGVVYVGRVHEQIRPALERRGWRIVRAPIVIWHYGYAAEQLREKARRNAMLLQQELEASPDDVWLRYHLGITLFAIGDYERASELLEQCRESDQLQLEQRFWVRLRLAQAALKLDRHERVEQLLQVPFPDPELEGLRRYVLAAALLQQHRLAEAARLLDSPVVLQNPFVERGRIEEFLQLLRQALGGPP